MPDEVINTPLFKVIHVTKKSSIRDFVEKNGLCFKAGNGYYQLTKPENIQHYKSVVARRESDGAFVSGDKIRDILGIPKDVLKFHLDTSKLPDFKIFIQSKSFNRVLMPNTDFLYEVENGVDGRKCQSEFLATPPPPPPFYGAGGPIEIVFSFDTTGSMASCLNEVRKNLQDLIQRLYSDIPTLRMAVFAHGDYCDRHNYITKFVDFTTDVDKLCNFVKNVASTGGGDYPEAYELVLREVREKLSWSPATQRALVMIGDAIPHDPDFPENKLKIDWKIEVDRLIREMGIRIYGVQCSSNSDSGEFFKHMAAQTHGHHLQLCDFKNIQDFIMAICYREQGDDFLQAYHSEVMVREGDTGMNAELHRLFDTLKAVPITAGAMTPPGTPPLTSEHKPPSTPVKTPTKLTPVNKKAVKRNLFNTTPAKKIKRRKCGKRIQRENVTQNNKFAFKRLHWSSWKVAVVRNSPTLGENWASVSRGVAYNSMLFNRCFKYAAAYEFAIQGVHSSSKSVVYLRAVKGFSRGVNWYDHLLASRNIQVRKAVRSGCAIFVRRVYAAPKSNETVTEGVKKMRHRFVKMYDYAWNTSEYGRKRVRLV